VTDAEIVAIVNPLSGAGATSGVAEARVALLNARFDAGRLNGSVHLTERRFHAGEMARDAVARGAKLVIAWGGDGTINETAGPLIGTTTALGIVPSGSGDGLARSLGLPRDPADALTKALEGDVAPIDVGMLGSRHFLNIAGVGFDAGVAAAFNRRSKRGLGGYIIDGLTGVWSYRCRAYSIDAGGERMAGNHFLIAFANGREYGNGLVLAPDADPADGQLNMVVVSGGSPLRQLWRSRRLTYRRLAPAEGVRRLRVTSAVVQGEALQCHVDGQTFETSGTLDVRIKPRALNVAGLRKIGVGRNFDP
jgi:YegS/Rv2252/BmrU family lipid kinase